MITSTFRHIKRVHEKAYSKQCEKCGKWCSTHYNLTLHQKKCSADVLPDSVKRSNGILECDRCNRRFISSSKFLKHQANNCTEETAALRSTYRFQCEKCLQTFPIASNLYKHRARFCEFGETKPKRTYPCDVCLIPFASTGGRARHKKLNRCKGVPMMENRTSENRGNSGNVNVQNDENVNIENERNIESGNDRFAGIVPATNQEQSNQNLNMEKNPLENTNFLSEQEREYYALFGGMVPGLVPGFLQSLFLERNPLQSNSIQTSNDQSGRNMNPSISTATTGQPAPKPSAPSNEKAVQQSLFPNIENMNTSPQRPSTPEAVLEDEDDVKEIKQELYGGPDYKPAAKNIKGIMIFTKSCTKNMYCIFSFRYLCSLSNI